MIYSFMVVSVSGFLKFYENWASKYDIDFQVFPLFQGEQSLLELCEEVYFNNKICLFKQCFIFQKKMKMVRGPKRGWYKVFHTDLLQGICDCFSYWIKRSNRLHVSCPASGSSLNRWGVHNFEVALHCLKVKPREAELENEVLIVKMDSSVEFYCSYLWIYANI